MGKHGGAELKNLSELKEATRPLPLSALRESISCLDLELGYEFTKEQTPPTSIELEALRRLMRFLSSDPKQRTLQSAWDVYRYAWIALDVSGDCDKAIDDMERDGGHFDWSLMEQMSESQLTAAITIVSWFMCDCLNAPRHLTGVLTDIVARGVFETPVLFDREMIKKTRSRMAKRAADASHKNHRLNNQKARDWYAAHSTMTKDAAAEKMAKDGIVHASFRTIRGYLIGQ
jgi:hypothetical protein